MGDRPRNPNLTPEGRFIPTYNVYVRLGCGHSRVDRGNWHDGAVGEWYYCDICKRTTVTDIAMTTDMEPYDWRPPDGPRLLGFGWGQKKSLRSWMRGSTY